MSDHSLRSFPDDGVKTSLVGMLMGKVLALAEAYFTSAAIVLHQTVVW